MRINFRGQLEDVQEIRAGHIGCGGHSFRNILPVFQFTPVKLAATCDLIPQKAQAYADKFGAQSAYTDYREMIEKEDLDAVFVVVGYDERGRPTYPQIAIECLNRGVNVFIEKPPAATAREVEAVMEAADRAGKIVLCGLKRMFFQTHTKAKALMDEEKFGEPMLCLLQREECIPTVDELRRYFEHGEPVRDVLKFLDHFCHPASVLLYLMGMPQVMFYHRAANGAGTVTFEYDNGAIASLAMTYGGCNHGGSERLTVTGTTDRSIVVQNTRIFYFQGPGKEMELGYGNTPNFYTGPTEETAAMWEPEFLLGQLYSKGLFIIGYYDEVLEFAGAVLDNRQPTRGTLLQCWQITHMFEKFIEGPGKRIELALGPPGS